MGNPIVFNTIDVTDKTPRTAIENDFTTGVRTPPDGSKLVLIVAQALAGCALPLNIPQDMFRPSDSEGYGAGSAIDMAVKAAFVANPQAVITALGVADAGGATAAAATLTATGPATQDGQLQIWVNGVEVDVAITNADTATVIAAAIAAALNAARPDIGIPALPLSAAAALGVATLTSRSKGAVCNGINVRWKLNRAAGVTIVLNTAAPTNTAIGQLAGGTGTAPIAAALANAQAKRYHDQAICLDDATSGGAAQAHVESDADAEHGKGEFAMQAINSTLSAHTTLAAALNSRRMLTWAIRGSESWSVEIAAAAAAVMGFETVATRPYNTLVLNGIKPPPVESQWIRSELKSLLANGCSPLVVVPGGKVAILRAVLTYTTNLAGNKDYATFDVTIMQGLDRVRDLTVQLFQNQYPRARWADSDPDGLLPPDVATPAKVAQDLLNMLRDAEAEGTVQNVDKHVSEVVVNKVGTNCQYSLPTDIVDGLHEIFGKQVLIRAPFVAQGG